MPRFYFDHRDGDEFARDEDGLEFDTLEQARDEATAALGDMAKDALPGLLRREMAVEVSDHERRPILRAALWFEVQLLGGA